MFGRLFSLWKRGGHTPDDFDPDRRDYFALQEPYGNAWGDPDDDDFDDDAVAYRSGAERPDYSSWDDRLEQADTRISRDEQNHQRGTSSWWQPRHWRGRRKRWWAARVFASTLLLFFLMIGWLAVTAPLSKSLEPIAPPQLTLLAADGTPIARNGAITDLPVDLDTLPDHVTESFLAIEDRRFFSHWGIDPRGLARAVWARATGGPMQGGSTITQQLAKFTFLTSDQTFTRKGQEMLIAFWLEAWLTKDEILERYLSNAYFGDNVYGLRAASLHYFYRQPENLKPEQAAMLAGLVQAPSRFAPTKHYDRAAKRMQLVLNAMVAAGYLNEAEATAMPKPKIDSRAKSELPTGTYFADWALPEIRKQVGTGYSSQTFTTTLDSRLQDIARKVVSRAPLGEAQVALVAMRTNGEVVAMIGGKEYRDSPFNRATQAKRQPGSTFKLFVYLAALEAGMDPDDTIDNSEIVAGSYRPKNSGGSYSETITLEEGFARSSNVAAVRLFNKLGDKAVIEMARSFGITSPMPEGDPSLALGTSTVSLLELTAAYAGVAGNEFPVKPQAFKAEEAGWFDWLWSTQDSLYNSEHEDMEQMLRLAINSGTGRAAMLSGPNFGKTGTSQNNRDALFVGYADDLVVGVWIGNDDNSPLDGVSGGGLPARIWRDFMRQAQGVSDLPKPKASSNPEGPVEPMDVPDLEDIPIGENGSRLRIDEDEGITLSTEVEGVPLEFRLDENGIGVEPGRRTPEPVR
ncbi:transglycosylase domain-containing protein [Pontixanthobacter gangjinensis]|uniref:Penicillin-binding protein n=1 Tax=Pontixanthobacter gangjinensis TaxID=1028742 RepID=A0A6I4SQ32_9SPHN|nr:transglycosylase domain-containing protein [Pontixanthobacter gangjinensis]MXO57458.1 penicillin-binding protein [Pontixanthobacter gangjinensis]